MFRGLGEGVGFRVLCFSAFGLGLRSAAQP